MLQIFDCVGRAKDLEISILNIMKPTFGLRQYMHMYSPFQTVSLYSITVVVYKIWVVFTPETQAKLIKTVQRCNRIGCSRFSQCICVV